MGVYHRGASPCVCYNVFVQGLDGLEVVGRSPWRKQRLRADSLDSSSEEEEGEEARNDSMCSSDEEDERPARCVVCPLGAADGISSEVCVIYAQCVVCVWSV